MKNPVPIDPQSNQIAVADLVDRTKRLLDSSKAPATRRAYKSTWKEFTAFCRSIGQPSLPASPETVALYITHLVENKKERPSTVQRKMAAVSQAHLAAGHESPVHTPGVRSVLQGVRRTLGTAQEQKQPLLTEHIRKMVELIPGDTLRGKRDRCHLILTYSLGARRSEVTNLDVEHVTVDDGGLTIVIRNSKTNQGGEDKVAVCYGTQRDTCPVRSYLAYVKAANITTGPLFRRIDKAGNLTEERLRPRALSKLIKKLAPKIGIEPALVSAHSCRSGFVTQSINYGQASLTSVMRQTRHRSINSVKRYDRPNLYDNNASAKLGL